MLQDKLYSVFPFISIGANENYSVTQTKITVTYYFKGTIHEHHIIIDDWVINGDVCEDEVLEHVFDKMRSQFIKYIVDIMDRGNKDD